MSYICITLYMALCLIWCSYRQGIMLYASSNHAHTKTAYITRCNVKLPIEVTAVMVMMYGMDIVE